MDNYKFKYVDLATVEEINKLWDDHGEALEKFGKECAVGAVLNYRRGLFKAAFKGCIFSALVAGVAFGVSNYFVKRQKEKEKIQKEEP